MSRVLDRVLGPVLWAWPVGSFVAMLSGSQTGALMFALYWPATGILMFFGSAEAVLPGTHKHPSFSDWVDVHGVLSTTGARAASGTAIRQKVWDRANASEGLLVDEDTNGPTTRC